MMQGTQNQCSVAVQRNTVGKEVGLRGRGHMYTYSRIMLMYSRNHHNIVKQLFLQLKKIFKLEMIKLHEKGMLKAETG